MQSWQAPQGPMQMGRLGGWAQGYAPISFYVAYFVLQLELSYYFQRLDNAVFAGTNLQAVLGTAFFTDK